MTSKEVSIKLVSRQSDGNTKEETELISAGLYEATEKGYRISYEESEATGFEGSVTTLETEGCRKAAFTVILFPRQRTGDYMRQGLQWRLAGKTFVQDF